MVVGLIWVAFDTGFLHNRHWQPPPSPSVLQGKIPVIDPDQGADFQTGCINMREGNSPFNAILWHTTTLMILLDSRESSSATGIILPLSDDYQQRLDNLTLPTISTFLHTSCSEHFTKIANDNHHPLNSRINVNTNRTSARRAKIDKYRPSKCRTTKRQNTFFEFYMRFFN